MQPVPYKASAFIKHKISYPFTNFNYWPYTRKEWRIKHCLWMIHYQLRKLIRRFCCLLPITMSTRGKFDTSTPIEDAMLSIIMVFAQSEKLHGIAICSRNDGLHSVILYAFSRAK